MADRNVTVCAACERACCWLGRFPCEKSRKAGIKQLPESKLRDLGLEHPSYWRAATYGDVPEVPKTALDVRELAEHIRAKGEFAAEPGIFVGYLVHECGMDRATVHAGLVDVWSEAAAEVWRTGG